MIIFATDLDRTLLPNGHDEDGNTIPLLFRALEGKDITIVYVSGRNMALFEEARNKFDIPLPDFFLGSVGTEMFKKGNGVLVVDGGWIDYLRGNTAHWDVEEFKKRIGEIAGLRLQEPEVQNEFKLSFYLDDFELKNKEVVEQITRAVAGSGAEVDVVYSVDPLKNVGLIDVLPKVATKVTALEYLREQLGAGKSDVVYCGDSGNDVLPLTAGYKSILVKNAHTDTKDEVVQINKEKEFMDTLYIADGRYGLNGNYSSGILEGLIYFGVLDEQDIRQ